MTIISGCYFIYCLDLHADNNLATGTVPLSTIYMYIMCILVQNIRKGIYTANVYNLCIIMMSATNYVQYGQYTTSASVGRSDRTGLVSLGKGCPWYS